jgi:hypothetical protein
VTTATATRKIPKTWSARMKVSYQVEAARYFSTIVAATGCG